MPGKRQDQLTPFFDAHHRDIWWYLRYLGCTSQEADDLTQESIAAILASTFEFQNPAAAIKYWRTAARRLFAQLCKESSRHALSQSLEHAEEIWETKTSTASTSEQLAYLEECMTTLDRRSRRALELQYREKLERQIIAQQLGVSFLNIKMILQRAKASLRKCIERKIQS